MLLNHDIKPDLKSLMQQLIALDKETQKFDRILKDVRVETYETLWHLMEINKQRKSLRCVQKNLKI